MMPPPLLPLLETGVVFGGLVVESSRTLLGRRPCECIRPNNPRVRKEGRGEIMCLDHVRLGIVVFLTIFFSNEREPVEWNVS